MSIEAEFKAFVEKAARLRKEAVELEKAFTKGYYIPSNPKPEEQRMCDLCRAVIHYGATINYAYNQLKKDGKNAGRA